MNRTCSRCQSAIFEVTGGLILPAGTTGSSNTSVIRASFRTTTPEAECEFWAHKELNQANVALALANIDPVILKNVLAAKEAAAGEIKETSS